MREHIEELIFKLEVLGIKPSPEGDGQDDDDDEWEDYEGSDDNGSDVEMS
jgi:hypothetical protein